MASRNTVDNPPHSVGSDVPFLAGIVSVSAAYVLLIVAMLVADAYRFSPTWTHVA